MVRAFFREVGWPFAGLSVGLVALGDGLLVLGVLLIVVALIGFYFSITDFLEKRRGSLTILDWWHCYYFTKEKQVRVSIPLDITSDARFVRLGSCT